jgi:MYXO-CTERM domain-containing protein
VKGLPPVDRLDAVRTALYNQQSASSSPTLHVIGYGLLALALGAVVLRRRSLVT